MTRRACISAAACVVLLDARAALAHDAHDAVSGGPSSWDIAVMLLLVAAAAMYLRGTMQLHRRGAHVRNVERVAFWVGWIAMFVAVAPPMDAAAAAAFSSHMAQHELLMLIGAPLMIVGRPILPWLWAIPDRMRPAAAVGLQNRGFGGVWRWLTLPAFAWALHGAVIWLWHAPVLFEAALRSEAVHALQHASFVGTAVLFWWGLIYGRYGRAAYGASALFVFVTMMHTGALGALFTFSTSPYYPLYRERASASAIDAVADQQLAGLYMWIPSGVVLMIFALALLFAWLSESDRRARATS
ncbi:MAG TPA: cytochrome c oxidase assembly protein [Vicinamibacterales bacterium]|nr:cytochrome c oxidase assembly protein [Vicinamibacterales bacterium]